MDRRRATTATREQPPARGIEQRRREKTRRAPFSEWARSVGQGAAEVSRGSSAIGLRRVAGLALKKAQLSPECDPVDQNRADHDFGS